MNRRGRILGGAVLVGGVVACVIAAAVAQADPSDPPQVAVVPAPAATRPATLLAPGFDRPLPTTPGDHKLRFHARLLNGKPADIACLLHLPPTYASAGPDAKHPMLVFLHGSGESGVDLAGVYTHGPMTLLRPDGGNPAFTASCPLVVLCPQCPPRGKRWETADMVEIASAITDDVTRRARVDPDRVYLTGLSMGGQGAWALAMRDPDRFAAIAPMNGLAYRPDRVGAALRTVPVWSAVGLCDEEKFIDAAHTMQAALTPAPVERRFNFLVGNGHDAFWPTYQDPDFFEWLLTHRRPTPAGRAKLAEAPPPPVDTPMPTTAGRHFCTWATSVGDQQCRMDFVLTLPPGYDARKRYPTLLFLREGDTVGPDYADICLHGPDLAAARHPSSAAARQFILVSPHWPAKCDWQTPGMTPALLGLLDHAAAGGVGIDPDRVVATGINAGANGVWRLASHAPHRFAAVLTIETNIPPPDTIPASELSAVTAALSGRAYVATGDADAVARLTAVAKPSAHPWHVTALPADADPLGDRMPYADPAVLDWLACQRRPAAH